MPYQREKKRKGHHQHQSQSSKNVININVGSKGGGGGGGTKKRRTGGGGGGGGGGFDPLAYNEAISMSMPHTNYVPVINTQQKDPVVVQPQVIQQDNKPSFWDIVQQGLGYGIAGRIAGGGGNTNNYYSAGQEQPKEFVKTDPVPPISGPSRKFSIINAGGLSEETTAPRQYIIPRRMPQEETKGETKGGFVSSIRSYFTRAPEPPSSALTPVSSSQGVNNMRLRPEEKDEKVDALYSLHIRNPQKGSQGVSLGKERAAPAATVPIIAPPPQTYATNDILGLNRPANNAITGSPPASSNNNTPSRARSSSDPIYKSPTFNINTARQTESATKISNDGSLLVGGSRDKSSFKTPEGARVGRSPGGTRIRSDTDLRNNREENTPGNSPTPLINSVLAALGDSPLQRSVTKIVPNAPKKQFTKNDQSLILTHSEFERAGESDNLLDPNASRTSFYDSREQFNNRGRRKKKSVYEKVYQALGSARQTITGFFKTPEKDNRGEYRSIKGNVDDMV